MSTTRRALAPSSPTWPSCLVRRRPAKPLLLVRVLLGGQAEGDLADFALVPFLDRQRPGHQVADLLLAGVLVDLAEDLPVAELAGLGHRQELEAVELVGLLVEVDVHEGFALFLGFRGLVEDRRLLALPLAGQLGAATLGLLGLLAHGPQRVDDVGR